MIWLSFNFIFIILHLPKTQEEEYKVFPIFPHSWSRCLKPCKTISAHCLWFCFISSLNLLHTQRNPQHFLIVKLLAIHTGIRLREPLPNICLYHICQSLLGVSFQQFVVLFLTNHLLLSEVWGIKYFSRVFNVITILTKISSNTCCSENSSNLKYS